MNNRIETLLEQLTLEEKCTLLAGADLWRTPPIERLGIPALKMSDGPNGARGGQMFGGVTAACFPCGAALASTWNTELVERVGVALAEETKTKSAHVLLGPTVNIHRSPLGGRNFECYSEDPFLTARLAVAYIRGLQSQGIGASLKHYACNDAEFERMTLSTEIAERPLREIYLYPFMVAMQEAEPWTVMASYNKVNGVYASEHPYLLTDILKQEWGFEGLVVSDWTAVKSTVPAANAGLDLEMPGPPRFFQVEALVAAVNAGQVPEAVIDDKVRRILGVMEKCGVFESPEEQPERAVDRPEHRQMIREAAAEALVVLQNDGILPLNDQTLSSIAVIGPNAATARIMGGGSARVNYHYAVAPLEGIRARCGDAIRVTHKVGCTNYKDTPILNPAWLTPTEGAAGHGLTVQFFNSLDFSGAPVLTKVYAELNFFWFGQIAPEIDPHTYSARLSGTLAVPDDGAYTFSLTSAGLSRIYLDGREIVDNWTQQTPGQGFFGMGTEEIQVEIPLVAGQPYAITVEYSRQNAPIVAGLRVGCMPPVVGDPMQRAVDAAAAADVALLFMGLSDEWDSEGFDRPDMELPGDQVALIEHVAAVIPRPVVVLTSGGPLNMLPWLDKVAAVVQAWYPGQELGNAVTDVLFGDVTASGKLPTTFPKRLEDNPAYLNFPGENGKVTYGEGIFVGYRYYDKKRIEPLFPFGHGLSYTTFAYSNLRLSAAEIGLEDSLEVAVDVTNTGARPGKEIVQLYVRDVAARLMRPEQELKGFAKVSLAPGETRTVTFTLNKDALSYYDPDIPGWAAEAGTFEVRVGASSRDIRATATFELVAPPAVEAPPLRLDTRLHVGLPLRELLADADGKAVLEQHLGALLQAPQAAMAMDFSLLQIAQFVGDMLTPQVLRAVNEALNRL